MGVSVSRRSAPNGSRAQRLAAGVGNPVRAAWVPVELSRLGAESTDAPHAVMETALSHVVRNQVEAAYARSNLFERRRTLMEQWAEFLGREPETGRK